MRIKAPLHVFRRRVIVGCVLAVLAVAVPIAVVWIIDKHGPCAADGLSQRGENNACVGVTDGAHPFDDHLKDVTDKIRTENEKVLAESRDNGPDYYSVAYLASFTLTEKDSNREQAVRRELQGAYFAMRQHNSNPAHEVKMRLLIANTGSAAEHWDYTVDQLIERKESQDRLVAVTGLGPSVSTNIQALEKLSNADLATVASTMTTTAVEGTEGFARVPPTNEDQAQAAAAHIEGEGYESVLIVQDDNEDNHYANTLAAAFQESYAGKTISLEPVYFDSGEVWRTQLDFIASEICSSRSDVIFFAGRGAHLTHFVNRISKFTCAGEAFTVMTGDDITNLTDKELEEIAETGTRVIYTGLAHPDMGDMVEDTKLVDPDTAQKFKEAGQLDKLFPDEPRDDGRAMMGHDAVLVAAQALSMITDPEEKVTGEGVGLMFRQIKGGHRVLGASGYLTFGDNGNAENKAVPILEVTPEKPVLLDVR